MTRWLLTREDDAETRAWLSARGVDCATLPCLETQWLDWPWRDDCAGALLFFSSGRAVEAWQRSGVCRAARSAALSPATSEALEAHGVTPTLAATGGVVVLARALEAQWSRLTPPPSCIRYPTSHLGLVSPEQVEALAVLTSLARVERAAVYDVVAPAGLAERVTSLTQHAWAAVFSSPSAVQHFFSARAASAPQHVVCFGQSTARAWDGAKPHDWPRAIVTTDVRKTLLEVTS